MKKYKSIENIFKQKLKVDASFASVLNMAADIWKRDAEHLVVVK
jgi:hypothetical protein